jgi:hypothetical protein
MIGRRLETSSSRHLARFTSVLKNQRAVQCALYVRAPQRHVDISEGPVQLYVGPHLPVPRGGLARGNARLGIVVTDERDEVALSACGNFYVRCLRGNDFHVVGNIQTDAFFQPSPIPVFEKFHKLVFRVRTLKFSLRIWFLSSGAFLGPFQPAVPPPWPGADCPVWLLTC